MWHAMQMCNSVYFSWAQILNVCIDLGSVRVCVCMFILAVVAYLTHDSVCRLNTVEHNTHIWNVYLYIDNAQNRDR